jgi:hypothetical protein
MQAAGELGAPTQNSQVNGLSSLHLPPCAAAVLRPLPALRLFLEARPLARWVASQGALTKGYASCFLPHHQGLIGSWPQVRRCSCNLC